MRTWWKFFSVDGSGGGQGTEDCLDVWRDIIRINSANLISNGVPFYFAPSGKDKVAVDIVCWKELIEGFFV